MEWRYTFRSIDRCNMCGGQRFKILGMRLNRSQGRQPKLASGVAVSVKQCRDCSLIFSDPQPIPASMEDHYGVPAEEYFALHGPMEPNSQYFISEIAEAKKLLSFSPGMKALDVGAGLGKAMTQMRNAGFDAYGIEPSASFRDAAVEYNQIAPDRIQLSSVESAEFPAEHFDFITFGAVLEHLYDPALAIERCMAWLKPHGILHAEVPSSRYAMDWFLNLYFRLRGTNYVTCLSPMHTPFHLYQFGLESFERHGARAGYAIARHLQWAGSVYHLPRFAHGAARWLMNRTRTGMQLTVYLRKTLSSPIAPTRRMA